MYKALFSVSPEEDGYLVVYEIRGGSSVIIRPETRYTSTGATPFLAIAEVCQKLQLEYEAEQMRARDKRRIVRAFVVQGLEVPEAYR